MYVSLIFANVLYLYTYKYLPYKGLDRYEAKKCLRHYVNSIASALAELHIRGLRHNDVRADNVCFDAAFTPILIDFDRSSSSCLEYHMYTHRTTLNSN